MALALRTLGVCAVVVAVVELDDAMPGDWLDNLVLFRLKMATIEQEMDRNIGRETGWEEDREIETGRKGRLKGRAERIPKGKLRKGD